MSRKMFCRIKSLFIVALSLMMFICIAGCDASDINTSSLKSDVSAVTRETVETPTSAPTPEPTQIVTTTPEPTVVAAEPVQEESDAQDYVLNKNTKKFHYPNCKSVNQMKEKNKEYVTATREEIIDRGYEPCKNCNP